jgi:Holliday junction DNA helicase RuvA
MLQYLEGEYRGLACHPTQLTEEVGIPILVWVAPLGMGLQVWVSAYTWQAVLTRATTTSDPSAKRVALYTHMQIREDAWTLTGFEHEAERDLFILLLNSNGIGHKTALGLMSCLRPEALVSAIQAQDIKALTQAKGVGKRAAEKLCVELKDKLEGYETPLSPIALSPLGQLLPHAFADTPQGHKAKQTQAQDVLRADLKQVLRDLGYDARHIEEALDAVIPSEIHYKDAQMNPMLSSASTVQTADTTLDTAIPPTTEVLLQQCLKWLARQK